MKFGNWAIKFRWWIIAVTILIVMVSASGMRFIKFNNDSRIFFSKENPQLKALDALENTYTKSDNVLFVIAPKNGVVFTRETLAAVKELTDASWKIPYSSRVDSITNFQHTRVKEDDLLVEDLVGDTETLSDKELEEIKNIALSEPLLLNRQISPSGHVTSINVTVLKPAKSLTAVPEISAFVRHMVSDFQAEHKEIDIYLNGGVLFDNAFGEVAKDDMSTLMPLMYLVLILIMWMLLRSIAGTISTVIVIFISVLTSMGLAGWLGIDLTPASANAPTIILTLAIADSIHILVTMLYHMRHGKTKHEAIIESMRVNMQPVFLTSATTAIGFLTLNFSDAPPFRDLGNIVAMGIISAYFFSILFLPALISVLPVRIKSGNSMEGRMFEGLGDFIVKRRKAIFMVMMFIIVTSSAGILRIDLNDNFIKYFDERYDIRIAAEFVQKNLTGLDAIEYSLNSGESGGINNPDYLNKVEEFANWYRKQPKVVHVTVLTDIIKRLNKNMHGDDESYYRIPEKRDLAAQYLLLYEMSLPFGLDLNNQIDVDKSSTRMFVILNDASSKEIRTLDNKARGWLKKNAPGPMLTYGTGLSVMFAHISERNINSMLGGSILALVLISAILILALRSFKLGIISLIPNLTPAFVGFGIWGFFMREVGLAVSIMIALTLGIVVDDTIHFMSKYLRARREQNMSPENAVRYTFNSVGAAMWLTSVVLVAGFSVLSFSGFKVNSDMGVMTVITISMALIMDFFLLPTLLMKLDKEESGKPVFTQQSDELELSPVTVEEN